MAYITRAALCHSVFSLHTTGDPILTQHYFLKVLIHDTFLGHDIRALHTTPDNQLLAYTFPSIVQERLTPSWARSL
jgi:hypothetical protein